MDNAYILDAVKLLPVYLLFVATFAQASLEKFFSGGVPDWFKKQFEPTILNVFQGSLSIQYYLLAVLEMSVVLLFLLSAGTLEFLPGHDRTLLKAALVLALLTFCALGIGLRLSGDFQGAANLFAYFGVTFLIFVYIERFAS